MAREGLRGFMFLVVLTLLIGGARHAKADPILVAQFNVGSGGGTGRTPFTDVASVSFGLVYGPIVNIAQQFPDGFSVCIGCEITLPVGSITGSFDFNVSNSPDFTDFVMRATDGIDELLHSFTFVFDTSDTLVLGGGGGGLESNRFPSIQIDFIRLTVNNFSLGPFCCGTPSNPGTTFFSSHTWQFFGTSVPEPSTMLLLASGLIGLGFFRRSLKMVC